MTTAMQTCRWTDAWCDSFKLCKDWHGSCRPTGQWWEQSQLLRIRSSFKFTCEIFIRCFIGKIVTTQIILLNAVWDFPSATVVDFPRNDRILQSVYTKYRLVVSGGNQCPQHIKHALYRTEVYTGNVNADKPEITSTILLLRCAFYELWRIVETWVSVSRYFPATFCEMVDTVIRYSTVKAQWEWASSHEELGKLTPKWADRKVHACRVESRASLRDNRWLAFGNVSY